MSTKTGVPVRSIERGSVSAEEMRLLNAACSDAEHAAMAQGAPLKFQS